MAPTRASRESTHPRGRGEVAAVQRALADDQEGFVAFWLFAAPDAARGLVNIMPDNLARALDPQWWHASCRAWNCMPTVYARRSGIVWLAAGWRFGGADVLRRLDVPDLLRRAGNVWGPRVLAPYLHRLVAEIHNACASPCVSRSVHRTLRLIKAPVLLHLLGV